MDGHGLEAVYAIPGSWADHERVGKIKTPSLPPYNRGEADGVRGGEGRGLGMGEGVKQGWGMAVANII